MKENELLGKGRISISTLFVMWKERLENGDLKYYLDSGGCLTIEWSNTSIFAPTGKDFDYVMKEIFTDEEQQKIKVSTGIKSLILVTSVKYVR